MYLVDLYTAIRASGHAWCMHLIDHYNPKTAFVGGGSPHWNGLQVMIKFDIIYRHDLNLDTFFIGLDGE